MWIFWSILLGIGLAMDAFAVSITNGLNDDKLKRRMMVVIALFFGVFQAVATSIDVAHNSQSYNNSNFNISGDILMA